MREDFEIDDDYSIIIHTYKRTRKKLCLFRRDAKMPKWESRIQATVFVRLWYLGSRFICNYYLSSSSSLPVGRPIGSKPRVVLFCLRSSKSLCGRTDHLLHDMSTSRFYYMLDWICF